MLLFQKLVDETQMGNPPDHAVRDMSSKFSIFLTLRAILKKPYHYETPCIKKNKLGLGARIENTRDFIQFSDSMKKSHSFVSFQSAFS